jgi:arylesterase/paraoxonase
MTEKGSHELRYTDKLRNCEDLVVDEKVGYVVLGCDEGRDVWNTVMVSLSHPHLLLRILIIHS